MDYENLFSQTKDLSILLVEDYAPLCDDMEEVLQDLFRSVTVATDGKKALSSYKEYYNQHEKYFDIVLTDIHMPLMNGVELSEEIMHLNSRQQIIVLSAHTDTQYLIKLINLNIAYFLTKPIEHEEMVQTLLRVSQKIHTSHETAIEDEHIFQISRDCLWDRDKLQLKYQKNSVELTRHELLMMQLFVEKVDQVCTNDDITQFFYGKGIDLGENNIRNLVFKLRKKLPQNVIMSIYGLGYKFTPSEEG